MLDIYEENEISWSIWSYKDAGTMSLLYSGEHTPWYHFVADFRKKWNLRKEITITHKILTQLEKKLRKKVDQQLRYKLHFRLRGILHNIYIEQLVRPKVKGIPWNEIKEFPLSFLYKNCNNSYRRYKL